MKKETVSNDSLKEKIEEILTPYPDPMSRNDFRIVCHIGTRTSLYLLQSGLVPCKNNGKKTRCYKIAKKDVAEYLYRRESDPMRYTPPSGWYYNYPKHKKPAASLERKLNYKGEEPFAFTDQPTQPTSFEAIYFYGGIKYAYGFSFDKSRILTEYHYHWPNGREALIFSRENNSYQFRENIQEQFTLAGRTAENRLYLSSSNEWNCPQTEKAYLWFFEKLTGFMGTEMRLDAALSAIRLGGSEKSRILHEMLYADLGIKDIRITGSKEEPIIVEQTTGLQNFGQYLTSMLEIDAFFLNKDRHTNNIAVQYNAADDTYALCPLFDNGLSLLADTNLHWRVSVYSRYKR